MSCQNLVEVPGHILIGDAFCGSAYISYVNYNPWHGDEALDSYSSNLLKLG